MDVGLNDFYPANISIIAAIGMINSPPITAIMIIQLMIFWFLFVAMG